jgi:ubiquinone/menaquinone biosynthesis C-methylase UbiE
MHSLSFDPLIALYDETRTVDARCFRAALDALIKRFPSQQFPYLFEPGIGNGRIAIPLAELGYTVTGADIASTMLCAGKERATTLPIVWHQADVTRLPYADATFDIAVATHLFYFIHEWQQAATELLRVVRHGGPIILMHTGSGAEIPALNARYKALCAECASPIPTVGVESTREVVKYYEALGCRAEGLRDRWVWTAHIRVDQALEYIRARAYSFTTFAPDAVHNSVVKRLAIESEQQYGDLRNTEIDIPNQVYMVIVSRQLDCKAFD